MIIIQLSGGLGNQLFQYALYEKLKSLGRTVKMDEVSGYQYGNIRPLQLSILGIEYEVATKEEVVEMTDAKLDIVSRVRRKVFGRKTKLYEEKNQLFDPNVLQLKDAYLVGCWQSEKYFGDIREILLDKIKLERAQLTEEGQKVLKQIQDHHAASIHIRRGDYLDVDELYGNICTEKYYAEAVSLIEDKQKDTTFYLFTNDVVWCKEHMQNRKYYIVDCNTEETGYLDLYLMSQCKHNIIANSSFSWWAAWLNQHPDKMVIAPQGWLNGHDCRDIYGKDMIVVDGKIQEC